jgi:hypothetical protein
MLRLSARGDCARNQRGNTHADIMWSLLSGRYAAEHQRVRQTGESIDYQATAQGNASGELPADWELTSTKATRW